MRVLDPCEASWRITIPPFKRRIKIMTHLDPPKETPIPFLATIEPDSLSLREAIHAIRKTGKLNSFDRIGYIGAMHQMAEAFDDSDWQYNAELLAEISKEEWVISLASDNWNDK